MATSFQGLGTEHEEDIKGKRERSPAFPFISLEKAIDRARDFAKDYKRYEARISNVGSQWGFKPMSSTVLQTIAALKYFGLMEEVGGAKQDRKVKLTDLAWRILFDGRPGACAKAIKEAALRPRVIAEHWELWGKQRPPDNACTGDLQFEKHFTLEAAGRFLTVYDETILYAKLADDDTLTEHENDKTYAYDESIRGHSPSPLSTQPKGSEVDLMEDERVVYTYESQPDNRVRLILSGPMNENLLEALEVYVDLQKRKLQAQKALEQSDSTRQLSFDVETQQSQPVQETGERTQPLTTFSHPPRPRLG